MKGWWLVIAAVAAGAAGLAAQTAPRSVQQGVYTTAQAERGRSSYAARCAECHGPDLSGSSFGDGVPPLKRDDFMTGRNLKDVFDQVKRSMPFSAPATLPDMVYLDVLAFVLKENGYPAGPDELVPTGELLKAITIPRK